MATFLSTMEILIFLKKIPLFSSLELEDLLQLKEVTSERHYKKGEYIIRQNESGNEAFIVINGLVDVIKQEGAKELKITSFEQYDYFGLMSIIENEPRSASIRAATDCMLLSINGNRFKEMIQTNAVIAFDIARVFSRRMREMNVQIK